MKKSVSKKRISGYQLRTKDLSGICYQSWSLEECKSYFKEGLVIVSMFKKTYGFKLRLFWIKARGIHYCKYSNVLNIFSLHIGWEKMYKDEIFEIVYDGKEN